MLIGIEKSKLKETLFESLANKDQKVDLKLIRKQDIGKKYVVEFNDQVSCVEISTDGSLITHWNLRPEFHIHKVLFNQETDENSPYFLLTNSIMYKVSNKDIIILVTSDSSSMNISFVSGVSGRVIRDFYIYKVDFSLKPSFVYADNFFVVSYLKQMKNFTRTEVTVIEILKEKQESDISKM